MRIKTGVFKLFVLFSAGVISCTSEQKNPDKILPDDKPSIAPTENSVVENNPNYPVDYYIDDYASLISGLPTRKYFKNLYSDTSYQILKKKVENDWSYVLKIKFNPLEIGH
jgi:hypothetical protein